MWDVSERIRTCCLHSAVKCPPRSPYTLRQGFKPVGEVHLGSRMYVDGVVGDVR